MGKIIKNGIPYGGTSSSAGNISYNNTSSGLVSSTVQNALTELKSLFDNSEHIRMIVVDELPSIASAENNVVYLIDEDSSGIYEEYIIAEIEGVKQFIKIGETDVDLSSYLQQVTTLPAPSSANVGKIYQYIGETTADYIHGCNYECESDGEDPATYSWKLVDNYLPITGGTVIGQTNFTRGFNASLADSSSSRPVPTSAYIKTDTATSGKEAVMGSTSTRLTGTQRESTITVAEGNAKVYTVETDPSDTNIKTEVKVDVNRTISLQVIKDLLTENAALTNLTIKPNEVSLEFRINGQTYQYTSGIGDLTTVAPNSNNSIIPSIIEVGNGVSALQNSLADIKTYIGYVDSDIVGLCADFENNTFTRLAGAVGKSAGVDFNGFNMYGGRRLCNLADDGTVNAWYGDDNYTEDGSNGQVMVYQPKFYYKVVPLKLQKNTDYTGAKGYHILKANYYLSDTPKAGFRVHPAFINGNGDEIDGIYLSAYEGSIYDTSENEYLKYDSWDVTDNGDDTYTINNYNGHLADVTATTGDKLSSISGVKPASGEFSNLTCPNAEILAVNRGAGWHSINIQVAMMEMLLFIVEYGTFNTQTAIANGVVSLASGTHNEGVFTGSTASLGNGSGMAVSTSRLITGATAYSTTTINGTTSIRYRGVENDWGDLWEHIIGANIWGNGSMGGGEVYINSDYTYADNKHDGNYAGVGFTLANVNGYIKYIGYGNEKFDWVMLCSKTGGSSALPVGDYLYKVSNLNEYRTFLLGGYWYSGANVGGFCLSAANGLGHRIRSIGSRLLYIP